MIPTGEIPRSIKVCVNRNLVDKLSPGTRVTLTGIYTIAENKFSSNKISTGQMKAPYMQTLGLEIEKLGTRKYEARFTPEEKEKFLEMSKNPEIIQKISSSIASTLHGLEDEKKAIACLLFGGSTKLLPDHMRLRGDINILLIGDPSTAKS